MKTKTTLLISVGLLTAAVSSFAEDETTEDLRRPGRSGRLLFEKETFGGNGRTCATCHGKQTGKFSIEEAQERFAKDPNDPLFRSIDSDDGVGNSYTRLLTTGTVRVDVPLAPNVKLAANPSATRVTLLPQHPHDQERDHVAAVSDVRRSRVQQRSSPPGPRCDSSTHREPGRSHA